MDVFNRWFGSLFYHPPLFYTSLANQVVWSNPESVSDCSSFLPKTLTLVNTMSSQLIERMSRLTDMRSKFYWTIIILWKEIKHKNMPLGEIKLGSNTFSWSTFNHCSRTDSALFGEIILKISRQWAKGLHPVEGVSGCFCRSPKC